MTIERPSKEGMSSVTEQPNATAPIVIGLAGWSGSGKTRLAVKLIALLKAKGLRVATIKHAHHAFDVDVPGKDSHTHRTAGADEVLVASSRRIAHMVEDPLPDADDRRSLPPLLERLGAVDVVLVEGFKTAPHPKLEVYREAVGKPRLRDSVPNIIALATTDAALIAPSERGGPTFDLDQPDLWIDDLLDLFR